MESSRRFLEYVARHEERLRRLVEGMTGDRDAFGESVTDVFRTLERKGTDVKDWERYFIRAARRKWLHMKKREERYERLEDPESLPDQ